MANPNKLQHLSRRDALKVFGGSALGLFAAACGATALPAPEVPVTASTPIAQMTPEQILASLTPTQKAALGITATPAAPDATPTDAPTQAVATATPRPMTLDELISSEPSAQLSAELRTKVEGSYGKAMGIETANIKLRPLKLQGQKSTFGVCLDEATGTPLYYAEASNGGFTWREAALPDVAEEDGRLVGVSVDGSENYKTPQYKEAVQSNFDLIMPDGSFMMNTMKNYGTGMGETFSQWAKEKNMRMRILSAFHIGQVSSWPEVKTQQQADAFLRTRMEQLLDPKFIRPGGKTEVIVAHESTVQDWGDGKEHWMGEGADNGLLRFPLFDVYGKEWPIKAYQMAYRVAKEKGLKVGEDVVFSLSDYDIFQNSLKTGMIKNLMGRIVQGVASDPALGLKPEQVRINIVDQSHMHADKENARGWKGIWTQDIRPDLIAQNIQQLMAFGDVEASEIDVSGTTDMNGKAEAVVAFVQAALNGGCKAIDLYQALRFDSNKPENVSLFQKNGGGYERSKMYWRLMQSLFQRVAQAG